MTEQTQAMTPAPAAKVIFSTTEAARKLGLVKKDLMSALMGESLVSRTKNRHYKANPALVRAGIATSGDLRWTKQGMTFLKKAYVPKK